jgi:adenine/guanine phosphoribosyltransferase-like PRPP-binding protein
MSSVTNSSVPDIGSESGSSVRPTTHFWQQLLLPADLAAQSEFSLVPPHRFGYPVRLPDGRFLVLPIREVAGAVDRAVASLISNQASFEVVRALAIAMTQLAQKMPCDVIVGLPTLGLVYAPLVAEGLGFPRYVPMGYSRKFWYDEKLSVAVQSLTTPNQAKRLFLDPNQLELVRGRRVLIIDDAVSTGGTLSAAIALLEQAGAQVVGAVLAMRQGNAWRARLGDAWTDRVAGVFDSPRLRRCEGGWCPEH